MAIVKAERLVKRYPKPGGGNEHFLAVDSVSLAIEAGEVFGILEPNGAGVGDKDVVAAEIHLL